MSKREPGKYVEEKTTRQMFKTIVEHTIKCETSTAENANGGRGEQRMSGKERKRNEN